MNTGILVVENEGMCVQIVAHLAQGQDVSVQWVKKATEVLERLRLDRPGVIFLSADMANGIATCNQIKTGAETCEIPVVLMSDGSRDEILLLHRNNPGRADFYLKTPLTMRAVALVLEKCGFSFRVKATEAGPHKPHSTARQPSSRDTGRIRVARADQGKTGDATKPGERDAHSTPEPKTRPSARDAQSPSQSTQEVTALKGENSRLRQALGRLQDEIDALLIDENDLKQLRMTNNQLEQQIAASLAMRVEHQEMQGAIVKLRERLGTNLEVEDRLELTTGQLEALKADLKEQRSEYEAVTAAMEEKDAQSRALAEQFSERDDAEVDLKETIDALQNKLDAATKRLELRKKNEKEREAARLAEKEAEQSEREAGLEKQANTHREEMGGWEEQRGTLLASVAQRDEELNSLREQVTEFETGQAGRDTQHQGEIQELTQGLENARAHQDERDKAFEQERVQNNRKISALEKASEETGQEAEDLAKQLTLAREEASVEKAQHSEVVLDLKSSLRGLTSAHKELQEQLEQDRREWSTLDQELKARVHKAEGKSEELESILARLNADESERADQLQELQGNLEKISETHNSAQIAWETEMSNFDAATSEWVDEKQDYLKRIQDLEGSVSQSADVNSGQDQKIAELVQNLDEVRFSRDQAEEESIRTGRQAETLKDQLEQLNQNLSQTQQVYEDLKSQQATLQEELESVSEANNKAESRIPALEEQLGATRTALAEAEQALRLQNQTVENLNEQFAALGTERNQLLSERAEISNRLREAEAEHAKDQEHGERATQELARLQKEIMGLEKTSLTHQKTIKGLEQSLTDAKNSQVLLGQTNATLEEQLFTVQQTLTGDRKEHAQLTEDLESFRTRQEQDQHELVENREEISALKTQIERHLEEQESMRESHNAEIRAEKERQVTLQTKLEETSQTATQQYSRVVFLENELQGKSDELTAAEEAQEQSQDRSSSLNARVQELETVLSQTRAAHQRLQESSAKREKTAAEVREKSEKIEAELNERATETEELRVRMEQVFRDERAAKQELEEYQTLEQDRLGTIEALSKNNKRLTGELRQAEKGFQEINKECIDLGKEKERTSAENTELTRLRNEAMGELNTLVVVCDKQKNKLEGLQAELTAVRDEKDTELTKFRGSTGAELTKLRNANVAAHDQIHALANENSELAQRIETYLVMETELQKAQQQASDMKVERDALSATFTDLRRERDDAQTQIAAKQGIVDQLAELQTAMSVQLERLKEEKTMVDDENAQLAREVTTALERVTGLANTIEEERAARASLKGDLEEIQGQLTRLSDERDLAIRRVEELEQEKVTLADSEQNLSAGLEKMQQSSLERDKKQGFLEDKILKATRYLERATEEINEREQRIKTLDDQLIEVNQNLAGVSRDRAELRDSQEKHEEDHKELENDLRSLSHEFKAIKESNTALESELELRNDALEVAVDEAARHAALVGELRQQQNENAEALEAVYEKLHAREEEFEALNGKRETLLLSLSETESTIKGLKDTHEALEEENAKLAQSQEALVAENEKSSAYRESISDELDALRSRQEEMQREYEQLRALKDDTATEVGNLRSQNKAMLDERDNSRETVMELGDTIEEIQEKYDQAQADLVNLNDRQESLEQNRESADAEVHDLLDEISKLRAENETLVNAQLVTDEETSSLKAELGQHQSLTEENAKDQGEAITRTETIEARLKDLAEKLGQTRKALAKETKENQKITRQRMEAVDSLVKLETENQNLKSGTAASKKTEKSHLRKIKILEEKETDLARDLNELRTNLSKQSRQSQSVSDLESELKKRSGEKETLQIEIDQLRATGAEQEEQAQAVAQLKERLEDLMEESRAKEEIIETLRAQQPATKEDASAQDGARPDVAEHRDLLIRIRALEDENHQLEKSLAQAGRSAVALGSGPDVNAREAPGTTFLSQLLETNQSEQKRMAQDLDTWKKRENKVSTLVPELFQLTTRLPSGSKSTKILQSILVEMQDALSEGKNSLLRNQELLKDQGASLKKSLPPESEEPAP